jgi:predicted PurR-regulated permease PerM
MKTNHSYALTASVRRGSLFHSRVFIVSLILALIAAFLPAVSALAAPAGGRDITENIDLAPGWQDKLSQLRWAGYYYDHVQFYPADFEKLSDLARVQELLEKYGIALRAANTIVLNHAGFDIEGNIKHEVQAARSVRDLAMYLQVMRGLREKMDEIPGGR